MELSTLADQVAQVMQATQLTEFLATDYVSNAILQHFLCVEGLDSGINVLSACACSKTSLSLARLSQHNWLAGLQLGTSVLHFNFATWGYRY
jgi:hypothetical protein